MEQSKKMALTAYEALDEKKAEEIKVIGIGEEANRSCRQ